MKRLLQIFGISLAVLWVPITSHCAWENIAGLPIFQCATETPQDSDCADDACVQVETASYKVTDPQIAVPPPLFNLLMLILPVPPEILPEGQPSPVTAAPMEFPVTWQFFSRTALPPRAPSFVS